MSSEKKYIDTDKAPFACTYSPQLPELLMKLGCSIAISTYQAGKIILISPKDKEQLVQLPRHFNKPMGIASHPVKDKIAVATLDEVIVFSNSKDLAFHYPKSPQKYDAMYMPRMTFHTGTIDIHDLSFGVGEELFAVNTLFSTIVQLDSDYNFTPFWQPPFIDQWVAEDRCHLNGMAMASGKPAYATAFNQGNTAQSWRPTITTSGTLFDVATSEVVATNLPMPHSPRLYDDTLFVLLSATGQLVQIDTKNGRTTEIVKIGGFVRGMSLYKEYLFVGISKIRKTSTTFSKLDFSEAENQSGIAVIHLPTGQIVGRITYLNSVEEIYDVHILANTLRPNILNTMSPDYKLGLSIPGTTFWGKAKEEDL